jgi:hypothetical protein
MTSLIIIISAFVGDAAHKGRDADES